MAAFAGCIQAESTPPEPGSGGQVPVAAGPAEFDETTGAITGSITTSDLAPIAGAQVGILPSDVITETFLVLTDVAGQFTFSHVPPGTHTLQASALGFEAASKRATVEVGVVATTQFILTELPSEEPYLQTIYEPVQLTSAMYKLTPECLYMTDSIPKTGVSQVDAYRTQAKTCGGVRSNQLAPGGQQLVAGCSACESHTATDKFSGFNEYWGTIVGEVTWQAQSGLTGRGFLFDISAPNVTRGSGGSIDQKSTYTWYQGTDEGPIHIRIDKPTTLVERNIPEADWNNHADCDPSADNNCDWFFRMFGARCDLGNCDEGFGPDYGLLLEAKAEVYFTYFIRQGAPEGFSALPDA